MRIQEKNKTIFSIFEKTPVWDIICPLFRISPNGYNDVVVTFLKNNKIYKLEKVNNGKNGNQTKQTRRILFNKVVKNIV